MKLLATIRETDVDPSRENLPDDEHINYRQVAKVVLFDGDNKVALNYYPSRSDYPHDEYYLPGGGLEVGETVVEALHREAMEETGCKIKDIAEIGYVVFYHTDRKLKQEAFAFTAGVDGDKGELAPDEKEGAGGLQVVWRTIDEAIKLIEQNHSLNHAKLNALTILNEVKNNLKI